MDTKRITIQLTGDQQRHIKDELGEDYKSLVFEPLEDRDAPSVFGIRGDDVAGGARQTTSPMRPIRGGLDVL